MRTSCSRDRLGHVEHDDRDLGLLERGAGAQRRVEVGALLQVHATTDAGGVDEAPQILPPSSTLSSTGSRVVPASSLTTTRSSPAALLSSDRLADVRAAEDGDPARAADLLLGDGRDIRQHLHDSSSRSATPRPWIAETGYGSPRPRLHSAAASRLLARVVDLVGDEEDGLARCLRSIRTTCSSVDGRADHRVDDEEHGVGRGRSRPRPARRPRRRCPCASGSQPPVSTRVKRRSIHSALYVDAVARDAGGVLDDGLAAAEDAVDERRLADVRAPDDRDAPAAPAGRSMPSVACGGVLEELEVLVVELVVGEAGAQRLGALLGELLVERRRASRRVRSVDRASSYSSASRCRCRRSCAPVCAVDRALTTVDDGLHGLFEIEVGGVDDRDARRRRSGSRPPGRRGDRARAAASADAPRRPAPASSALRARGIRTVCVGRQQDAHRRRRARRPS